MYSLVVHTAHVQALLTDTSESHASPFALHVFIAQEEQTRCMQFIEVCYWNYQRDIL